MKEILFAAITVTVMALAGCGSSNSSNPDTGSRNVSCSDKGSCPNDTVPTASAITTCQNSLAGACASEYQAMMNCAKSNEKCDSSGNMDLAATEAACPTEFSNVVSCCMATPTACQ